MGLGLKSGRLDGFGGFEVGLVFCSISSGVWRGRLMPEFAAELGMFGVQSSD